MLLKLGSRAVSRRCHCSEEEPWMQLVAEYTPKRVWRSLVVPLVPNADIEPLDQPLDEPDRPLSSEEREPSN